MKENDNNNSQEIKNNDPNQKGHGRQGVDKAPNEEPSTDYENVVADTQKGKQKVDGDPSNPKD